MIQVAIIIHTLQVDAIILHIQHHLMVSTCYKQSPDLVVELFRAAL